MNLHPHCGLPVAVRPSRPRRLQASVLIVVMWITFGVVGLALYFAHSMEMNMRAADNQLGNWEAEQAVEAGAIYCSNVLADVMQINIQANNAQFNMQPYMLPPTNYYQTAGVKVGAARFYIIGRDTNATDFSRRITDPVFGLVDEASKVNLNNTKRYPSPDSTTATNLLQSLPRMTFPLLSAIYDWTSTNTVASQNGAKSTSYEGLNPPYECKDTNFDTVGELRMVYGMNLDELYGEDANLNGALDPNENDGQVQPPTDNSDGKLDPGFLEFFTVYTQEPTNIGAGNPNITPTNRIIVTNLTSVTNFIATNFPNVFAEIRQKLTGMTAPSSVIDFALRSGITEQSFVQIEPFLMNTNTFGLININTAPAEVLACIPGIGTDGVLGYGSANAQTIINYRQGNPSRLNSVYWLMDAMSNLGTNAIRAAGPCITSHSWQYSADIAAVGHNGRGYHRVRFVFDCSGGVPLIVFRQDLTYLGWALGKKLHDQVVAGTLK